jgi:hypothetical protein
MYYNSNSNYSITAGQHATVASNPSATNVHCNTQQQIHQVNTKLAHVLLSKTRSKAAAATERTHAHSMTAWLPLSYSL